MVATLTPSARKTFVEASHELAVAIVDQEPRPQVGLAEVPTQVACLLGDPGRGRLLGAAGQEDPARGQLDEEQHIQLLQPNGVDGEEVAGQDGTGVRSQESLPAESRPRRRRRHPVAAVLAEFVSYYNQDRPHRSLGLETPVPSPRQVDGKVISRPVLGSFHHVYERAA